MKGQSFLVAISFSLLVSGCGDNKFTQCEQIFQIARRVTETSKNVSYSDRGELTEMKLWLETATMMNKAARKIKALHIDDSKLIGYQNKLATIYRIYSQATYDAVRARENKSLPALQSARLDAQQAGTMQRNLIQEINAYCLNRS